MLERRKAKFAVVGGIAVSFRTIERFTKDIDLAVTVTDDAHADSLVYELTQLGYTVAELIHHDDRGRLATARLKSSGRPPMRIDLIFAFTGIESEIVETAEEGHILSDINVRVATIPSLIAMKTLAADWNRRPQDILDLQHLITAATPPELEATRELLELITKRGYNGTKDLQKHLDGYIEQFLD
ncbi:MAG TPA: nucleotidyl transferase AbiEii/AbiGii toxin family protein [Pyrinomonadaceae bacterium]|nr:nucleotidyl transferase AbiEii/AbiGii toxin family protein [Pyrinomonadaceae bacterium]